MHEKFMEKIHSWYGKIETLSEDVIFETDDTLVCLVETEDEIELVRVFTIGDQIAISVDFEAAKPQDGFDLVSLCQCVARVVR